MKVSSINLNLLITLNALLAEVSISNAAKKLNLSQPTVSLNLKQLREIFEDDLLVRGATNRMVLTCKAKDLRETVHEAMDKINIVFTKEKPFDPLSATNDFRIGMSDYTSTIIMPKLTEIMDKEAPDIRITMVHMTDLQSIDVFEKNRLDLAVGYYDKAPHRLNSQFLFRDDVVCIADKNHPVLQGKDREISLHDFLYYHHIYATFRDRVEDCQVQAGLDKINKKRIIRVQVPNIMTAMRMLKNTELICVTPNRIAMELKNNFNFAVSKLPFKVAEVEVSQFWQQVDNNNPPHHWLRRTIKRAVESI